MKEFFEGDMVDGELEIGQVSAQINAIKPAADVVAEIWNEFVQVAQQPFYIKH